MYESIYSTQRSTVCETVKAINEIIALSFQKIKIGRGKEFTGAKRDVTPVPR